MKDRLVKILKEQKSFILLLVLLFAVRWSLIDHYRVPTGSMIPTVHIGDHLLVNKLAYNFRFPFIKTVVGELDAPKRGEIVVFYHPNGSGMRLVKRAIGLPGDHVQIDDGSIQINGQKFNHELVEVAQEDGLEKKILKENNKEKIYTIQTFPLLARSESFDYIIPEDHYLFLGDNRDRSADGRFFGPVHKKQIIGRAIRVLYSVTLQENYLPSFKFGRIGQKLN